MRHLKKFESFQSINEEEIFGEIGAFFGQFNKESIKKAENILKTPPSSFKPMAAIDKKRKEFEEYKAAYEKDPNSKDAKIFKEIVSHIVLNKEAVYVIEVKDGVKKFRAGIRYGREGGTGAGGGGGS